MSALLAPGHMRARWREEWLGEIAALDPKQRSGPPGFGKPALASGQSQPSGLPDPRDPGLGPLSRAWGAPKDALLLRAAGWSRPRLARGWAADIRDAWRGWRRAPFAAAIIIGCFSVGSTLVLLAAAYVNAMVAADVPGIRQRDRLAHAVVDRPYFSGTFDLAQFRALETRPDLGADLALLSEGSMPLVIDGHRVRASAGFASGRLFNVLGTRPALGRLLQPADDRPGAPKVMVLSHAYWARAFDRRPDVIGTHVGVVDSTAPGGVRAFLVVGVTEEGFSGPSSGNLGRVVADRGHVWMPLSSVPAAGVFSHFSGLARLAPGSSWTAVESAIRAAVAALPQESGPANRQTFRLARFYFAPVSDPGEIAFFSVVLMSVPGCILLIACINIAGLQLARATARRTELVVRASLGAGRARIARLLAIDIGGLAVLSGVASWMLLNAALPWSPYALPVALAPDWRLAALAFVIPITITWLSGWLPARRVSRMDLAGGLRTYSRDGRAQDRVQRGLVVAQLALSLLLLIGGSLVMRGVLNLAERGPDADTRDEVLSLSMNMVDVPSDTAVRRAAWRDAAGLLTALPSHSRAALSTMGWHGRGSMIYADTVGAPRESRRQASGGHVTSDFFDITGRPLVSGRTFEAGDVDVAVVNESFVAARGADRPVLGKVIEIHEGRDVRRPVVIVGVVSGGWNPSYLRGSTAGPVPEIFVPFGDHAPASGTLFVRSKHPADVAPVLRRMQDQLPMTLVATFDGTLGDLLARDLSALVWLGRIMTGAALLALALAALGLFGVISLLVARRTREFGIRYALGARPAQIGQLVVRHTAAIAFIGVVAGLTLSVPVFFVLRATFIGVQPWDPVAICVAVLALVIICLLAPALPIRHASAVDPLAALRTD